MEQKKDPKQDLQDMIFKLKQSLSLIVVEGKKDKSALIKLGIPSERIYSLERKPIYKATEEIAYIAGRKSKVIILTDLDKTGKQLYGKLNSGLQRFGITIDKQFREFLFKHTQLRQIEGIVNYLNK